ncbi:MAG: hypothetical protein IKN36_07235 [Clostridia bacterium]|nr:hypothetical protein [Clostridia bacterium]MBR6916135.1 hypothetical protein [Clostridia bacterium]
MKRIIVLFVFLCILVLTGCHRSADSVTFNTVESYTTAGRRLINYESVTEETFLSEYPVQLLFFFEIQTFRFAYRFDPETEETIKENVVDGFASAYDEHRQKGYYVLISQSKYVPDLIFECDKVIISVIESTDVELYHFLSYSGADVAYAKLRIADYYVSFAFSQTSDDEVVEVLRQVIKANK